jgi:hypothetical protein
MHVVDARLGEVVEKRQDSRAEGVRAFEIREHEGDGREPEAVLGDALRRLDAGEPPAESLDALQVAQLLEEAGHVGRLHPGHSSAACGPAG